MDNLKFWQVDAFADVPFSGNPAAVFVLDDAIDDALMQNIAKEMNLSETAYVLRRPGQNPLLRWFTPMFEIDLCGHATLASAHVYLTEIEPGLDEIVFDTNVAGPLRVRKNAGYEMDFPARAGEEIGAGDVPDFVLSALGSHQPKAVRKARDLMLVYDDAQIIKGIKPDFNALMAYKDFIIVTALSDDPRYDFISRFFCADDGIAEDPVTGSAHCTLTPYWSNVLGKTELRAYQASERGGELGLKLVDDRVLISGQAVTVIEGIIRV
jgi:predicted PhzF superfamily epimerase YddE/YHI9